MVRHATPLLGLVTLLIAFGLSVILPVAYAHYGGHGSGLARSVVGSRLPVDGSEKAAWLARLQGGESSVLSPLVMATALTFVVLVALLAAVLVYRSRKERT